jgi:hypothetical protein
MKLNKSLPEAFGLLYQAFGEDALSKERVF